MKKLSLLPVVLFAVGILQSYAGEPAKNPVCEKEVIETVSTFENVRRPITNPTLFDTVLPQTKAHAFVMHQTMPDSIEIGGGGLLPLGGDLQLYALQLEYALNERLSLVASKDGYLEFQPSAASPLSHTSGWANLAAGMKYAWLYRPERGDASSFQLIYEIPSGDRDVWQGTGDGMIIPTLSYLKTFERLQYTSALGFKLPVDTNYDSSVLYTSHHVGFHLTDCIYPLIELNWFHVTDPGNGAPRFAAQAGGQVPALAAFEGGDLINLGAVNSGLNEDIVTLGVGFRADVPRMCNADFGFAWEIPLTDEEANLMENRFTFDLEIRF